MSHSPVIVVTGTDTEVGKTVATAAIAAALTGRGQRICVVKPTQTGLLPGEHGDAQEVQRLAAPRSAMEFVRLPDPLAPDVAARIVDVDLPTVGEHAARVAALAEQDDTDAVLVEGAGGLLVHLDANGGTLADLAQELIDQGVRTGVVVIARDGLGTLNHTELTLEALRHRELPLIGVIVGAAHPDPDLAQRTNLTELGALAGGELLGVIPDGAATLDPHEFRAHAAEWIRL